MAKLVSAKTKGRVVEEEGPTCPLLRDSTKSHKIGERTAEEEVYAESYAALIDKYVSKIGKNWCIWIMGGAVVVIAYGLIEDNKAGRLTNLEEVIWAVTKSGIILIFFVALLLLVSVIGKMLK